MQAEFNTLSIDGSTLYYEFERFCFRNGDIELRADVRCQTKPCEVSSTFLPRAKFLIFASFLISFFDFGFWFLIFSAGLVALLHGR